MKKLEASTEENASTSCLFKDYCSQTMGENLGWGWKKKLIFLALLGDLGVGGEKRALAMATRIFR